MTHAQTDKEKEKGHEATKGDEAEEGGKKSLAVRVTELEEKLENVIKRNHLLEVDR